MRGSGRRSLQSLDRLRESVESVCPLSDVSLHSSMAKPNLLTSDASADRGGCFLPSRLQKTFLVSERAGQEAPWGMYTHAAQTSVSSSQVRVCWASETAGSFPVEAVGGGWGGSQLTGSAKAYQHTHTGNCALWCALEQACSVYSCSEVKCASCR